jgi:hypothetical protein
LEKGHPAAVCIPPSWYSAEKHRSHHLETLRKIARGGPKRRLLVRNPKVFQAYPPLTTVGPRFSTRFYFALAEIRARIHPHET